MILLLVLLIIVLILLFAIFGCSSKKVLYSNDQILIEFISQTPLLCQPSGSVMIAKGKICELNGEGQAMVFWESITPKYPSDSCQEYILKRTDDSTYNTSIFGDCGIDATTSGLKSMVDFNHIQK